MIQTVNVNVAAQPTSGGPESFLVLSQNENGRQIRFRILGDDLPAGCTATFSGTKPDGNVYSASGMIDGNFVLLDEEIQMTAVSGRWDAKLSIAKGTENIMTSLIRVTVVADAVSGDSIPSDSELDGIVAECRSYAEAAKNEAYGSPLTAATAAAMTDQSRVYVYTGSETGYTSGHWYYYNGTAWADGGVYNAVAVDTDTTLSIAGKAADAKEVGDQLTSVKENLSDITTATSADVGKALKVKTVTDGKVGEWEFGTIDMDTVTDAQSMAEMTDTEKLYRYDGKIYYYNGTEWTEVGTGSGGDAELTDRVDTIERLTINVTESTVDMAVLESLSKKLIDTDGTIIDGTLNNQFIRAYLIPSGATDITIKAADRVRGEAIYAVYASSTISGCDSTTLIERAKYTSQVEKNIAVPNTAGLVLIQGNVVYTHTANITTKESKSAKMIADAYSATKLYYVGDYCNYGGLVYKRTIYTGTVGDWNASEWELVAIANDVKSLIDSEKITTSFPAELFRIGRINGAGAFETDQKYKIAMPTTYHNDETITYEIADGYTVTVCYYDENDTYLTHNDSATTFNARTIMAGSHFRLTIRRTGVSTNLQEWQIPLLASAVTFKSTAGKKEDDIATGVNGAMDALEAQMYQRGASPKTFTKAPCIIVAGQSNIDGRVPVADLPSDIVFPFENIKVGKDNGTFSSSESAPTSKWGITTPMFSALNALGTPIYKIKTAQGDTSISEYGASNYHWTPFLEKISNPNYALLLTFDKKIKKCLEVTANTFDIRAFVWQQGEGDRGKLSKRAALDYYKNFKCLVAYVRGVVGNEKLPVICGTVSHNSLEYDATVEAATIRVAEEDPYMTCIDMSGATLLDSYHFDATNAVYFGQMAYDALIDFGVITGTKINPTRPW